ncbi:Scn11a [Symbiodinium natans]|uniref:Scn11a protein n=1 Tax=Symbiodinium natans TaxID=878477 RepID=A0A812LGM2_9DINO|nr:Scn11a [Symbiodinium natans]CAE7241559.1 Scn11a [Symbiodinium natans]
MARYAQNTTCGNTCPWGSGDSSMPDAFTVAAMKAARRRESKETITSEAPSVGRSSSAGGLEQAQVPELQEIAPRPDALKSSRSTEALTTCRSAASRASRASRASTTKSGKDVEVKVMNLIQKCLDKKVLEMQELRIQAPASEASLSARSTETALTQLSQAEAPSHVETDTSVKAELQPEAVTMAGKRAQAQKLSDAALGKFDDDASRLAYLEMQKSAAEARNKNRSALCFGYEPPSRVQAEGKTMAGKRAQAQKLSDASLGKFDADQSRLAYLEMQKSAAEVRNKNRSAQCFEKAEAPQYPALLREVEGLAEKGTHATMAGKRAKAQKVSEATLGKFDADKSLGAYLDMQKSAEELRNKHRVGQGVF